MRAAYLGPQGSYSHLAATKMTPTAELFACANFRAVIKAVESGECDCAIIPIENTLNGCVLQNIDLLQAAEGLVGR